MKSNTKGKLILICLGALLSLSFVFGSNITNYPVKLSEDSVDTNDQDLGDPRTSANGAFKIYWAANGTELTDSTNIDIGGSSLISDGEGGAIIAYTSNDRGGGVFAQKINSLGEKLWGENGIVICNASPQQKWPFLCTDKAGGAIITWEDERGGGITKDIYAQHVSSDGITHWGDGKSWGGIEDLNGTVICDATGIQDAPQICVDVAGGAIITWEDERGTPDTSLYAQRVDSDGITHWGESWWSGPGDRNGTVICNATGIREDIRICSDESGGAIMTWNDIGRNDDIYAQHVDSDGITHWGDGKSWGGIEDLNGTVICNATGNTVFPQICKDGAKGAIITWQENRGVTTDIYAQHISADGITHWGDDGKSWGGKDDLNGTVICDATGIQEYPQICADGAKGALFTWVDERGPDDIYAQKIDKDGNIKWDTNGVVICNATDRQIYSRICADGAGGAILTWNDERDPSDAHIYAQHVDSDGITHWGDGSTWGVKPDRNGTAMFNVEGKNAYLEDNNPEFSGICGDDYGGAIIAWFDERVVRSLFAQRVRGRIISPGGGALPAGDDDDDDDDDEPAIPYGNYYLGFAGLAIVALIVIMKRKALLNQKK